jgi:hypothetical protein
MNGESSKKQNKKIFVQTKLFFPELTEPTTSQEKGKGKDVIRSCSFIPNKRKEPEPDITYGKRNTSKQKLNDMLLDENFEKLDEKHVYCHYCDTGKPITLHRPNDGDRLWTHLNTQLHISNKANADKRIHKKPRTTFLTQFVTGTDDQFDKDGSNSQYKGNNNNNAQFFKIYTVTY